MVSHHSYVLASSKIDAINKALNFEGEHTIDCGNNPFELTCELKTEDLKFAYDSDDSVQVESEGTVEKQLYGVAWTQNIFYKTSVSAATKIHAIDEAMRIEVPPSEWSLPISFACSKVGNYDNDDGFQDD